MKTVTKISMFLGIALLTAFAVSAASVPALPSQSEVRNYITSANIAGPGYAENLATQIKADHPAWYYDLLKCSTCSGNQEAIVLYYADQSSQKGYGSIYYQNGKTVSPSSLPGYSLVESYKGTGQASSTTGSVSNNTGSTGTASTSTSANSCPNCQNAQSSTSQTSSTTPMISVNSNGSKTLTADQQKQLDEFMSYFDGKSEVTVDGIKEQAIKSFFNGV